MNEHWTTDPPEVGKRYWKIFWLGEPHNRYSRAAATGVITHVDRSLWRQQPYFDERRSIVPIPDPQPPPLPSGDEKERQ